MKVDDMSASDFVGVVVKDSAKESGRNDANDSTKSAEEVIEKG